MCNINRTCIEHIVGQKILLNQSSENYWQLIRGCSASTSSAKALAFVSFHAHCQHWVFTACMLCLVSCEFVCLLPWEGGWHAHPGKVCGYFEGRIWTGQKCWKDKTCWVTSEYTETGNMLIGFLRLKRWNTARAWICRWLWWDSICIISTLYSAYSSNST